MTRVDAARAGVETLASEGERRGSEPGSGRRASSLFSAASRVLLTNAIRTCGINVFMPSIGNYIRLLDSEESSDADLSQHSNDSALPTYWQLQVGPLINEDAKRMANQLRASGFKVFVEKTSDDVKEYFVMIGPKQERILMVKKTLQKEFELETQIFRYVYED